jgi:hypothetical protein
MWNSFVGHPQRGGGGLRYSQYIFVAGVAVGLCVCAIGLSRSPIVPEDELTHP